MYYLIDEKFKIVFGWSTKCGCTHVKLLFYFLKNNIFKKPLHTPADYGSLPNDIENYIVILIIRNPYQRIISGFLNKYGVDGQYLYLWKHDTITFSKFVDELSKNNWSMIDKHHFTQQTSEKFDENKLLKCKELKIYDLNNIDYSFIESIFNKKIPDHILTFKAGHERKKYANTYENYVYDLEIKIYFNYNVDIKYFYNEEIKTKIYNFYEKDFIYYKNNGFNYYI